MKEATPPQIGSWSSSERADRDEWSAMMTWLKSFPLPEPRLALDQLERIELIREGLAELTAERHMYRRRALAAEKALGEVNAALGRR